MDGHMFLRTHSRKGINERYHFFPFTNYVLVVRTHSRREIKERYHFFPSTNYVLVVRTCV